MGSIAGWLTSVNPSLNNGPTVAPGPQIGVPCSSLGSLPLPGGYLEFTITLNLIYSSFNCRDFPPLLATPMGITAAEIIILSCLSGSVILRAGAPAASVATLQSAVAAGSTGLPITQFVSGGVVVNGPSSSSMAGLIAGVVLGVIVLAILILVVVILYRRHQVRELKIQCFFLWFVFFLKKTVRRKSIKVLPRVL